MKGSPSIDMGKTEGETGLGENGVIFQHKVEMPINQPSADVRI